MFNNRRFPAMLSAVLVFCLGTSLPAAAAMMNSGHDRYGGPAYMGQPNLAATVEFVKDGGGPAHFSFVKALGALIGPALLNKEVRSLQARYGKTDVAQWVATWNYAIPDAVRVAMQAGVKLPAPATLSGKQLASALVHVGSTNGTFWTGNMLDHLLSNKVHNRVMDDIDRAQGQPADANYHRITNRAMYDLAQALGATQIRLAALH